MRAAVSPDGKYLAVLCLQDSGSVVHTFALTSADERGSAACADELFADLFWRGGKVCCVSQMRLAFFDDAARLTAEYPFGDLYLYDYAAEGDGFVTLALSRYRSGSAEQLVTVGASGNELGKCSTTGAVTSLSVNGKQVLVQYSDRLTLYNQQLDEIKSVEQNLLGVRRSVLPQSREKEQGYTYEDRIDSGACRHFSGRRLERLPPRADPQRRAAGRHRRRALRRGAARGPVF